MTENHYFKLFWTNTRRVRLSVFILLKFALSNLTRKMIEPLIFQEFVKNTLSYGSVFFLINSKLYEKPIHYHNFNEFFTNTCNIRLSVLFLAKTQEHTQNLREKIQIAPNAKSNSNKCEVPSLVFLKTNFIVSLQFLKVKTWIKV